MRKRSVLLITSALMLGSWWYFQQNQDQATAKKDSIIKQVVVPETAVPASAGASKFVAENLLKDAQRCLGIELELKPEETIEQFLTKLGAEESWHWDNYFLESPQGEALTIHVVPTENNNGREEFALKVFREDEEGPTLLEEKRFPKKSELEKALSQKLRQGTLKTRQTIDTLHVTAGLEVRRSRENGHLTELLWRSAQGKLDCKVSDNLLSCECK
jgi:hypothetical protein